MRPVKTYDIPSLTTPDQVLNKLEEVLEDLLSICDDVPTEDDVTGLKNNIKYMKGYYEQLERLFLDEARSANAAQNTVTTQGAKQPVGPEVPKQRKKISAGAIHLIPR